MALVSMALSCNTPGSGGYSLLCGVSNGLNVVELLVSGGGEQLFN